MLMATKPALWLGNLGDSGGSFMPGDLVVDTSISTGMRLWVMGQDQVLHNPMASPATDPAPPSVAGATGTAAQAQQTITGPVGGATSIATTGTGGVGGGFTLTGGAGGTAAAAATASTGGAGGAFSLTGGAGGVANNAANVGTNVGGAGGALTLTGGAGANTANGSSNTGGAGGAVSLVGGAGGTGGTAGGVGGNVNITTGAAGGSAGNINGGNLKISFGAKQGTGQDGEIEFATSNAFVAQSSGAPTLPTFPAGWSNATPKWLRALDSVAGKQLLIPVFVST